VVLADVAHVRRHPGAAPRLLDALAVERGGPLREHPLQQLARGVGIERAPQRAVRLDVVVT
jgi:hypothetical protein